MDTSHQNNIGEFEDRFPDGMRVLAVDNDLAYLKFLEASLRICNYEVTTVNQAKHAIEILRESNKDKFDMVIISDVLMNRFQLLLQLARESDLPVVMVTSNIDNEVIKKGISQGAFCYLVKPVTIEVFKTIWQHVFRNKILKSSNKYKSFDQDKFFNNVKEDGDQENVAHIKSKRKDKIEDNDEEDQLMQKKFRLTWTDDMKKQFEEAYNHLGPENAIPSKILALMKVEGLTRSHIASHLQKYRGQHDQTRKGCFNSRASNLNVPHPYMSRISPVDDESVGRQRLWNPNQVVLSGPHFPTGFLVNTDQLRNVPVQQTHATIGTGFYAPPRATSSNVFPLYRSSDFRDNMGYGERWQKAPMQGYDQSPIGLSTYPTSNIKLEHHHRQDYNHNWSDFYSFDQFSGNTTTHEVVNSTMQTKIEHNNEGYLDDYVDQTRT